MGYNGNFSASLEFDTDYDQPRGGQVEVGPLRVDSVSAAVRR